MQVWKDYQDQHKDRFLQELLDLLRIPSVSADSQYTQDTLRCAESVKLRLQEAGAEHVEVCPTAGHAIVYGDKIIDPALPTVLVYGHYDVQPADPLELWNSGPFDPVIKDGKIWARGSADDKGQFYMHVKAFETMVKTNTLPCNIKFMIEGEEEVGSANLGIFLKENKERLKADVVLISDTSMLSLENPSLDTGLRGLSYMEVTVTGPNRDLHSGVYGGAVANPATILCKMIASLHDENNHVTIPGFYDQVQQLTQEERTALNSAPFDEAAYKKDLGLDALWGEKGYTTIERTGIRPTLEVNGIWGGYTGEGSKTVLPSKASAKISMRLVPDQDWIAISDLFKAHFEKIAPAGVKVSVTRHHGGSPYVTPIDHIAFKAASQAIQSTFGKAPIPVRGGGSIPIVALFEKELGLKTILMGFGLDSDNLHSPNEKYGLENFYKGIETIPYFHQYFAELQKK
ncbi:Acetylornithine deacetylase/Succinyl-diaminopimelate desuccinylase [Chitinophaga costaii]|uniref:Acetylornithine deacetylase/Succinyl-diaminopimelate desuccinylase n=1 Tax=Chitinophaga costaii TaxID=1335309 RepID=A0A1C4F0W7_9BACT|nr:dipeptidase [Chitinophaga costaii]PUZ22164.1 dipeptidase [Chitinophaga costaii]SCC49578.1 Acetylornithine deacetylase/Succinyl-diaminopimelate desuccinylase [Chitinophaga costaii]